MRRATSGVFNAADAHLARLNGRCGVALYGDRAPVLSDGLCDGPQVPWPNMMICFHEVNARVVEFPHFLPRRFGTVDHAGERPTERVFVQDRA